MPRSLFIQWLPFVVVELAFCLPIPALVLSNTHDGYLQIDHSARLSNWNACAKNSCPARQVTYRHTRILGDGSLKTGARPLLKPITSSALSHTSTSGLCPPQSIQTCHPVHPCRDYGLAVWTVIPRCDPTVFAIPVKNIPDLEPRDDARRRSGLILVANIDPFVPFDLTNRSFQATLYRNERSLKPARCALQVNLFSWLAPSDWSDNVAWTLTGRLSQKNRKERKGIT